MRRFGKLFALAAAAWIGYQLGSWRPAVAAAARDQRQMLMDIDRDFDLATAREGAQGWSSYFAEDAVMLPAGGNIVIGRDAIRELMASRVSQPGYSLRWEPVDAGVSGDLGYTYGVAKSTRLGRDGKPEASYGKYVTIWKKQRDRTWKVIVDIGNSSPPPPAQK